MPRKARLEMPGDIHHVMARGLYGEAIFKLERDKTWFLNRLIKIIESTQYLVLERREEREERREGILVCQVHVSDYNFFLIQGFYKTKTW